SSKGCFGCYQAKLAAEGYLCLASHSKNDAVKRCIHLVDEMEALLDFLGTDYVALFIIIGAGIQVGRLSIKGISFDSSAVVFVAMLYGYGCYVYEIPLAIPDIIQQVGLLLFIFT